MHRSITTAVAAIAIALATPSAQAMSPFDTAAENAGIAGWLENSCEGMKVTKEAEQAFNVIMSADPVGFKKGVFNAYAKLERAMNTPEKKAMGCAVFYKMLSPSVVREVKK